jgi:hypothetical protein
MKPETQHATLVELNAGLDAIRNSPAEAGTVQLIVRRPATNEREILPAGVLDISQGLVGDDWIVRGDFRDRSAPANPDCQITIMNSRLTALVAGTFDRWSLAGDQLYIDLDLSRENLPAGTQLQIGTAVVQLRLRGLYARVIQTGEVRPGDAVLKLTTSPQKTLF